MATPGQDRVERRLAGILAAQGFAAAPPPSNKSLIIG
jgi:hypothetical protein